MNKFKKLAPIGLLAVSAMIAFVLVPHYVHSLENAAWCTGSQENSTETCVDSNGNVVPTTTNNQDLGSSTLQWKDGYFAGTINGTISASSIADGAVTSAKLATNSVTSTKIVDGDVTTSKIAAGAISSEKLGDSAVATAKIANGAVTNSKLADNSVTTAKIAATAVTEVKIEDGAVTTAKIAATAITEVKLEDGAVTTNKIGDNAATTGKILLATDMPNGSALCVRSDQKLGVCADAVGGAGTCTCN